MILKNFFVRKNKDVFASNTTANRKPRVTFASKTDTGLIRENNEDACLIDEKSGLFLVADGIGGANAGEVASRMAVDAIAGYFASTRKLVPSILRANDLIFETSRSSAQYKGMGTTIVACAVRKWSYAISWVGDSRLYLVRHNQIQQLTTDHSMVQEQVNKGILSPADAETVPYRNILSRALGVGSRVEPGRVDILARDDDFLILCSDGLHGILKDTHIRDIVLSLRKPVEICDEFIAQATAAGGRDNCTAVVVHYKAGSLWTKMTMKH